MIACVFLLTLPTLQESPAPELQPAPRHYTDRSPVFSPDGERIVFESDRDGNAELYVMNVDGSGLTRITDHLADDFYPSWSPDGERILFYSNRTGRSDLGQNNIQLFTMRADGSGVVRLTDHQANDMFPRWSPDGTRIAFASDRNGPRNVHQLFVCPADGPADSPEATNVTLELDEAFDPTWSPDGSRLAFSAPNPADGAYEIYVVDLESGDIVNLTRNPDVHDWNPSWSPDGRWIAYQSATPKSQIHLLNLVTGEVKRVTFSNGNDGDPMWSTDARQIVFSSDRDGRPGVYRMNADGSDQVKLTNKELSPFIALARTQGWDEARAALPDTPAAYFTEREIRALARHFRAGEAHEDALAALELGAVAYPESFRLLLELGDVQLGLQRKEGATATFERALALAPGNATTVAQLQRALAD